ncbi:MAG: hypothetical protein K2K57_01365 [Oscillospiraceae bacterium]|nr:hypothetical protein [Oscillospiraceae bacterium]
MKKGKVYKALKPKWVLFGVKIFLSAAAVPAVVAAMIFYVADAEIVDYFEFWFGVIICVALFAVIAVMTVKSLLNEKRAFGRRQRILDSFDEYSLERLEEEVRAAELYFKCFYVLDEFLFVPKAGLLLRYDDIKKFKTINHSTNGASDGVFIEIYDSENIKYYFSVNKWRDYKKSYNEFMALLSRKGLCGSGGSGGQKNPDNSGYIPVGKV